MAKELGLITRFPGGWPKGVPRSGSREDRQLAKARLAWADLRRQLAGESEG